MHIGSLLEQDLRRVIASLGQNGGQMGESVYDTAQVCRLQPGTEQSLNTLKWIAGRQHIDGGWGSPAAPLTREVSTLAAILALHTSPAQHSPLFREAVEHGVTFIHERSRLWQDSLPEDLPTAIELLLPRLLDEARLYGLSFPDQPYSKLIDLGRQRRQSLAKTHPRAGTPIVHSFEAWGTEPLPDIIDTTGGVGLSPAATAAWLRAAQDQASPPTALITGATRYLHLSSGSTENVVPGVQPLSWPISRFEQIFGLYALSSADLLDHPGFRDVVKPQLDDLFHAVGPQGVGFCDGFSPDGDDTATALAVLRAAGYPVSTTPLSVFEQGDHYCTWTSELQPAISVTAHAVHALSLFQANTHRLQEYLIRYLKNGVWLGDKWNVSWLYTTAQVVIALVHAGKKDVLQQTWYELCHSQRSDGGWGVACSTTEETAYALFALWHIESALNIDHSVTIARAENWMLDQYVTPSAPPAIIWLAKTDYRPPRISRAVELAATFRAQLRRE